MAFKIQKQLIPTDTFDSDPSWAQRQVWVYKLNSDDIVESFETEAEANTRKEELETADPTSRVYKVIEVVEE